MTIFSSVATIMPNDSKLLEDLVYIYIETEKNLKEKLKDESESKEDVSYRLRICTKFLQDILHRKGHQTFLSKLEKIFNDNQNNEDSPEAQLEAWYARDILTAAYFDRRKEHEDNLGLANKWGDADMANETLSPSIHSYLYAKIAGMQVEEDPQNVYRWAIHLFAAKVHRSAEEKENEVLTTLIKNEFTKLSENYLRNREEIDKVRSEAKLILKENGYIID